MEGHDKFRGSLRVLAPCFFSPALSIDFCSHTHLLEIMLETIFFTSKSFIEPFFSHLKSFIDFLSRTDSDADSRMGSHSGSCQQVLGNYTRASRKG